MGAKGKKEDVGDTVEKLDRKFKKACAAQAREYRKSESRARRTEGYAFAIEQRAKAELLEDFAEHGFTLVDD